MYKFSQVIKRILKDLIKNIITQGINLKEYACNYLRN